ncbi:hypothetical protein ACJMK2_025803 [Sinanodonta woodiana]|uniref:Protein kinase domain-containing protein n=1 Tax=Sinanodonta woodiana TaxID=1069815 RepID=A0ABD3XI56_SINWO
MKIGFVAPEVMTGCRPQQSSDIFSLGCVAYFIITGRRPFTKRNELLDKIKGPELLDKRISPAGIEFICACLQKSIGRRFQLGSRLKYVRQNQWLADMDIDREFPGSPLMKAIERLNKDEVRVAKDDGGQAYFDYEIIAEDSVVEKCITREV